MCNCCKIHIIYIIVNIWTSFYVYNKYAFIVIKIAASYMGKQNGTMSQCEDIKTNQVKKYFKILYSSTTVQVVSSTSILINHPPSNWYWD